MARGVKPIAIRAAELVPTGRPAVWAAIRRLAEAGPMTITRIAQASYCPPRTVRSYLEALLAAGIVARADATGPAGAATWRLVRDPGAEPPRLRPDGSPVTQGSGRDRLWRTMKMLKVFSAKDLAVAASLADAPVAEAEAHSYVLLLARAGYLRVQAPAKRGRGGRRAVYRLVRNTGPEAPKITRLKAVWDPNLRQITWRAAEPLA